MRKIFPTIVIAATLALIGTLFWNRQATTKKELVALQHEYAELRLQLESHGEPVSNISVSSSDNPPQQYPNAGVDIELARRMSELTITQSNTLALVEKLMARTVDWQTPPSLQQRESNITVLKTSAGEYQQKLHDIQQTVVEIMATLNISDNVATMDIEKGLDTPSLKAYWPFFEAKRKRNQMERIAVAMQLRINQEQIEAQLAR